MEKLEDSTGYLKFRPDTLVAVRKEFGLDKPGVLKNSIDILQKWISEQKHFVKKDFSRDYIERNLIICKGSVEKTKLRFDKTCTIRSLLPQYFDGFNAMADLAPYNNLIPSVFLPQLTEKHERIFVIRNICNGQVEFFHLCKYYVKACEFLKLNDYNTGIVTILDFSDANLKDVISKLNMVEARQIISIIVDSYGLRLRKLYIISRSKIIDTLINILKQILSPKLSKRIQVCRDYRALYKDIPKEILPEEFEGLEQCIDDLHEYMAKAIASETFVKHLKEMSNTVTDENYRDPTIFNEAYLGTPGSFKNITVD